MRELFRGYYPPSEDEFNKLWNEGLVVPDANVLLNLYRYSIQARSDLLNIFQKLEERIWIPHQVAYEYQVNRLTVMAEQRAVYGRLLKAAEQAKSSLVGLADAYTRHPILDVRDFQKTAEKAFDRIVSYLKREERKHTDLPPGSAPGAIDPIRDQLTGIFKDKVGHPYDEVRTEEIHQLGDERFSRSIPPGYRDIGKGDQRQYGDLIIWLQILDLAKETRKPILFLTDERKDDWWWIFEGKTVGPRPELIAEMLEQAGTLFHMYRPDQFIVRARGFLETGVSDEVVKEVRELGALEEDIARLLSNERLLQAQLVQLRAEQDQVARELQELSRYEYQLDKSVAQIDVLQDRMKTAERAYATAKLAFEETEGRLRALEQAADRQTDTSVSEQQAIREKRTNLESRRREARRVMEAAEAALTLAREDLASVNVSVGARSPVWSVREQLHARLAQIEARIQATEDDLKDLRVHRRASAY